LIVGSVIILDFYADELLIAPLPLVSTVKSVHYPKLSRLDISAPVGFN
jgi:hypothetical protein